MSKAETGTKIFESGCNCAQSVLAAYAENYGMEKNLALSAAVGFGAGMGRVQDICGAVSGAVMVLGLNSRFKEGDGRSKINTVYEQVHFFIGEFTKRKGSIKCLDLLSGCKLLTEEGQKRFREQKLRECCFDYVRTCCDILDGILENL
jgi:C_GCAxxG_C_C family probable redox protein